MISKEAVEAFKRFYRDRGVYLNHGLDCHLSDALSAALPVLLEDYLAQAWFAGATMMGTNNPSGTTTVVDNAKAYADRIIAMMKGGGE